MGRLKKGAELRKRRTFTVAIDADLFMRFAYTREALGEKLVDAITKLVEEYVNRNEETARAYIAKRTLMDQLDGMSFEEINKIAVTANLKMGVRNEKDRV